MRRYDDAHGLGLHLYRAGGYQRKLVAMAVFCTRGSLSKV
jgi:hypothetical protein